MTETDAHAAVRLKRALRGKLRVCDPLVRLFQCSAETLLLSMVTGDKRAP